MNATPIGSMTRTNEFIAPVDDAASASPPSGATITESKNPMIDCVARATMIGHARTRSVRRVARGGGPVSDRLADSTRKPARSRRLVVLRRRAPELEVPRQELDEGAGLLGAGLEEGPDARELHLGQVEIT